MDNIENNITVTINENDEPIRSGHSGRSENNSGRSGLPVSVKFFWLWNLLFELVIGVPFIGLMSIVGDGGVVIFGGLIFAFAHTAISASLFNRHYRKNGVPAWKFVLMNVLPVFIISAVMFLIPVLSELTDVFVIYDLGFLIMSGIFGACFGGYSIVYGVLLTAALGIGHLIEINREKSR